MKTTKSNDDRPDVIRDAVEAISSVELLLLRITVLVLTAIGIGHIIWGTIVSRK